VASPAEVHFCETTRPSAYTFQVVDAQGLRRHLLRPMSSLPVVGVLALTPSGGKPAKCVGGRASLVEADPAAATANARATTTVVATDSAIPVSLNPDSCGLPSCVLQDSAVAAFLPGTRKSPRKSAAASRYGCGEVDPIGS
jgi:hypothetical protein